MKTKLTILILTLGLTSLAFTPKDGCTTNAQVIGFDMTKCGCCWGWKIEVNNQTYIAKEIPGWDYPWIDTTVTYPIVIQLDYSVIRCNKINVTCITLLE